MHFATNWKDFRFLILAPYKLIKLPLGSINHCPINFFGVKDTDLPLKSIITYMAMKY